MLVSVPMDCSDSGQDAEAPLDLGVQLEDGSGMQVEEARQDSGDRASQGHGGDHMYSERMRGEGEPDLQGAWL